MKRTKKCPGCGREFRFSCLGLPCHGPCSIGEKIFVPVPSQEKELEQRLGKTSANMDFTKAS